MVVEVGRSRSRREREERRAEKKVALASRLEGNPDKLQTLTAGVRAPGPLAPMAGAVQKDRTRQPLALLSYRSPAKASASRQPVVTR